MSDDTFASCDFGLVCFLLTDARITLLTAVAIAPTRVRFVLAPRETCEQLAQSYFMDRAMANPRAVHECSRRLKSMLHAIRRGEERGR